MYAGANGAGKTTLRAGGTDPVDVEIDPDRIARQINEHYGFAYTNGLDY